MSYERSSKDLQSHIPKENINSQTLDLIFPAHVCFRQRREWKKFRLLHSVWSSWIIEGKSWSRTVNNSLAIWIPSKVNPFIHNSYFITFFMEFINKSCSIKPATLFNRYRYNPLFTGTFKEQLGMLDIKQRSTWPTIKFLGLWFCY